MSSTIDAFEASLDDSIPVDSIIDDSVIDDSIIDDSFFVDTIIDDLGAATDDSGTTIDRFRAA